MPSQALLTLQTSLPEVETLLTAHHGGPTHVRKVAWRACTVMASSHYERFIYALNENAVDAFNASGVPRETLPERLRLTHSKSGVELVAETSWEASKRAQALEAFVGQEAWLWVHAGTGTLRSGRLLEFMTAPRPIQVIRYFGLWGIDDVFSAITRQPHVRTRLFTRLTELVDRRNAIAHGDATIQPQYNDVWSYVAVVRQFAQRTDVLLSRHLARVLGIAQPW